MSAIPKADLQYMLDHPHQSYGPELIIMTAVCCPLAVVAVLCRFLARHLSRAGIGKDDYSIVVSLVLSLTYSFLMVSLVPLGFGKHVIYVKPADASPIGVRALTALVILSVATYSIKVSILLLYWRIFPSHRFHFVLIGMGVIVTAYFLASFFVTLFECLPVGAQLSGKPHTCINIDAEFDGLSFINSFFDFIILALPMPLVWRLQMKTKFKLQASAIFGMGLLACTASLVRAVYTLQNSPIDSTYADTRTAAWVTFEINISVVSACLPNLRPLFGPISRGKKKLSSTYHNLLSRGSDGTRVESQTADAASSTARSDSTGDVKPSAYDMEVLEDPPKSHYEVTKPGRARVEDLG